MLVKRRIAVKVIVTEQYKRRLLGQLERSLQRVELSQQQLEAQGRQHLAKLETADPARTSAFRVRLERQKKRQQEVKSRLLGRLAAVRDLELGAEHRHGVLDGFVEIRVGDNLSGKLETAEIVVKDDLVVETRNP